MQVADYNMCFSLHVFQGTWWYRSIKFSAEQILMDTTQLYYYLLNKTSNMAVKRELADVNIGDIIVICL